ncbi:MAG: putative GntR family transcriptional regulator [Acidimicrobiia bacterium]|nr:putative GntR family transcriptional regulator [Acidimicrobiia bacterium]
MRTIRYREIADSLRGRLHGGDLAAGRLLPSEAELSGEFEASRVTVRRALEVLREERLIESRQGLGWFAAADPVRQSLAHLSTVEAQMAAVGITPERRVLEFAFTSPAPRVHEILQCDQVLRVRRLNLADGAPFALITVWCRADLAADVSRADVERSAFYELLSVPLGGATQTIAAAAADSDEARWLEVPEASPVLRCERVTRSLSGDPVLFSVHVFPAHRTEFVVELAQAEPSIAPSGLRLVDSS